MSSKIKRFAVAAVTLFVLITQAVAQQSTQRVVIRAGHVLDVKSGKMLSDQAIVIEGDNIVSLGPASATPAADATTINLPNATVLPGLIDAHTHLTFNPSFGYEILGISIPREALIGAHNARVTLEAGFTTVRNVGARGYSDVALRDAINAGAQHYGWTLRQRPAALRVSRHQRWGGGRYRERSAQDARDHQVRR